MFTVSYFTCMSVVSFTDSETSPMLPFQEEPGHISLDWLLSLVSHRIEQESEDGISYLVDIMPNLKYMLKSPTLAKDCKEGMKDFEEQVSVDT